MDEKLEELVVEVTNHCYLKCIHCSSYATEDKYAEINIDTLESLIEDAIPLGLKKFTISGGEPFLYENLLRLVNFLISHNIETTIYTCGVSKKGNDLVGIESQTFIKLKKLGLKKIIFSLHSANDISQESISMEKDSYKCVNISIQRALKAGLEVELHTVPMSKNIAQIEEIIKMAQAYKIKKVSLLRLVNQGRCKYEYLLNRDQINELYKNVKLWRNKYQQVNIRMGAPFNCVTLSGEECLAGKRKLSISATGECFPCEAFKYLKNKQPKIYEKPLNDIWENDDLLNQLRAIDLTKNTKCEKCDFKEKCHGGCAGQRYQKDYNFELGNDSLCCFYM